MVPKYSQDETPEFRQRMDGWLQQFVELFRGELGPNYVATLLMGGYGRGWGAMIETPNGPMPINDIDMAVITNERLKSEIVHELRERATKFVNPDSKFSASDSSALDLHADVMNFTRADLPRLPADQFHYDLVHSARLVDGQNVLLEARIIGEDELDPGDAFTLLCNNASSIYESTVIGALSSEETRRNLLVFATKGAMSAGAALLIIEGGYSPFPDSRMEALSGLLKLEGMAKLIAIAPNYLEMVRDSTVSRGLLDEGKMARAHEFMLGAQACLLNTMRWCLVRVFGAPWIDDPCELGDMLTSFWRRERLRMVRTNRLKQTAKTILQAAGIMKKPRADWHERAAVFGATMPMLAAISLDSNLNPTINDDCVHHVRDVLKSLGLLVDTPVGGYDGFCATARAMVEALKCQNWVR